MPTLLLLALQAADLGVHIATDQFELIRAAANLIIAGGALSLLLPALRAGPRQAWPVALLSGAVYLGLNGVFLAQNGLTNPETEALRLPLFAFVTLTLLLLAWCARRARRTAG